MMCTSVQLNTSFIPSLAHAASFFIVNLLQWMLYVIYVNVALYGIEVD